MVFVGVDDRLAFGLAAFALPVQFTPVDVADDKAQFPQFLLQGLYTVCVLNLQLLLPA